MATQKVLSNGIDLDADRLALVDVPEGSTIDQVLTAEAQRLVDENAKNKYRAWFVRLPLADQQRIYDAETA